MMPLAHLTTFFKAIFFATMFQSFCGVDLDFLEEDVCLMDNWDGCQI